MSQYIIEDKKKITTQTLQKMKQEGKQIAMLTSYDYTTASIVDQSGVDMILVGDSASNVMLGNATTLPISLDEMILYARSVVRGVKRAFVLCDMPFGTYQVNADEAVKNAIKIMQETGVDGVKLEGGIEILPQIQKIIAAGIPVCGHLGLTPQSVHSFGGYGLRAKEDAEAEKLIKDAKALEEAGVTAIVLEKIPASLTQRIVAMVKVPIIGIGAGLADGQVLVIDDMLGKNNGFQPKFLRRYADLHQIMLNAIGEYISDVKEKKFPSCDEQY